MSDTDSTSAPAGPAAGAPAADAAAPSPVTFYSGGYCAQDSVGYLMRRVMQSIAQLADERLVPHGLTHGQWMPLFLLLKNKDAPVTVATLARDLNVDPGAATRMLDRLEKKAFISRCRSTEDRRVVHVSLTEEGRRVAGEVPKVLSQVLNDHLVGFSHDEWQTLLVLLRRMLVNAEALQTSAPSSLFPEDDTE
ncbi:MarR family winged helix-turn-helix transcriptional regulator [Azohydromonas lata]|uniref:MarR family transcriptional regulator n=1 Tax=Azohydromonas lata TaxID=45677 RepID=A0ABU5IFJ9_9BURK|nr:MarR family transcriptional regulator [Azohydromonas lata]MDZ5457907.1 MarR family transcriptional regulator [Azohydromonas lata]